MNKERRREIIRTVAYGSGIASLVVSAGLGVSSGFKYGEERSDRTAALQQQIIPASSTPISNAELEQAHIRRNQYLDKAYAEHKAGDNFYSSAWIIYELNLIVFGLNAAINGRNRNRM